MDHTNEYKGPLAGLNVIDFGHYYAGPMVGMLLADQGASVIKIVRPGEPELPSQKFCLLNRNKKLLTLDLKTEEGKAQALSLIEKADVLIENFRPGVMKRLGLGYSSIKNINLGLVYLSLPGFASTDKERAHIQAWEGILSAASGVYTGTSMIRQRLGFPPVYTAMPHCSAFGAIHGATAIMAALLARKEHGIGTVIEIPLADVGAFGIGDGSGYAFGHSLRFPASEFFAGVPDLLKPCIFSTEDAAETQIEKLERAKKLSASPTGDFYPCADGRVIFIWAAAYPIFTERLFEALGIERKIEKEGFVNKGPRVAGYDNNVSSDFFGMKLTPERKQRLEQLIATAFLSKTAEEWETVLQKAGVPSAFVRTRDEYLRLEPLLQTGVLVRMDDGKSVLTTPGRMADISGPGNSVMDVEQREPVAITFAEANALLQHRTIATNPDIRQNPLNRGDLLRGLKVVDLANVAAGPTASYVLALYGAEVIKVDHPYHTGVLLGPSTVIRGGKRSLVADLNTAPGQELLHKLVSWADVVIHNCLDDTAKRLGITHEQLKSINSNVVGCQLSTMGGTLRGGWEDRLGFDPVAQSVSGLMAYYGSKEKPHWHGIAASSDTIGGFCLAFTSLLGVWQQRTTGYTGEGRTSLIRSVSLYQFPYLLMKNGHCQWGESGGQLAMGDHSWQRIYVCRDKWIYVGVSADRAEILAEVVTGNPDAGEQALDAAFAGQDCAHWLSRLQAAGIACHQVMSGGDILDAANVRRVSNDEADETAENSIEFLRQENHPCGKPILSQAPNWVRIGEQRSWKRLRVDPSIGEDTREILMTLGYQENDIAELIRLNIVYEYLPALGSKGTYFFG